MLRRPMEPDEDDTAMPMPTAGSGYGDKGGAKMAGGMGEGVQAPGPHDATAEGYTCLAKFPLGSAFWTRDPEHGQA